MSALSKIDRSIEVLNFYLKRKRAEIDQWSSRVDVSKDVRIKIGKEEEFVDAAESLISQVKGKVKENLGIIPPNAVDLEMIILGSIMLESESFGERPAAIIRVASYLEPEHFYSEANQEVYRACRSLHNEEKKVTMQSVMVHLRKSGMVEKVGGAAYIAELTSKVSNTANLEFNSRVVIEFAIKRQLQSLGSSLIQDAADDTRDVFEMLEYGEVEFKKINTWIK